MVPIKGPAEIARAAIGWLLLVAAIAFAVWIAWTVHSSRAWKSRAQEAAGAARQEHAAAVSADTGAANATDTRAAIDHGVLTVRVETDNAVGRIQSYANRPVPDADLDPVDADVVRELEAAEGRADAAADRLQRTRGR